MASLRDIASASGASLTAVSAVLHGGSQSIRVADDKRAVILAAAKELQYRPNDDIALVAPWEPGLGGEGALPFLHALRATAPAAVQVQVAGATAIPELLARWKVGAVVTYDNFRAGIAEHCQQRGIPCLAANPQHERTPNAVHIDDGAGVAAAAERVLAAGCQRLALCAPRVDHQSHRRRIAALERVAAAHGVPCQIAEARDFAKASADLALGGAQGCGLLVLGDWYLAATSRAGPRDRVVSIKRPWSPWIRADLVVETPWDRVAALCVKRIESQWAGGAPGRSVTIAGQLEEYSCSSDSSF